MTMHTLFALAFAAPAEGSGGGGLMVLFIQFGALIAIFYFLLIRPQSQARKKHAQLLAGLKRNDEIITAGGIIGKVKHINENKVTIESGTAELLIERSRIIQVGGEVSPTATQQ